MPRDKAPSLLFVIDRPCAQEAEIPQTCIYRPCILRQLHWHESMILALVTKRPQLDDVICPRATGSRSPTRVRYEEVVRQNHNQDTLRLDGEPGLGHTVCPIIGNKQRWNSQSRHRRIVVERAVQFVGQRRCVFGGLVILELHEECGLGMGCATRHVPVLPATVCQCRLGLHLRLFRMPRSIAQGALRNLWALRSSDQQLYAERAAGHPLTNNAGSPRWLQQNTLPPPDNESIEHTPSEWGRESI